MEENASVYKINTVSRITVEGRAKFSRTLGPGFDQEELVGAGRAGQLNLCVETINSSRG